MIRDTAECLFQVVPKAKFKALIMSGRYERRNKTVLVGKEKLSDGREDFVVLDSEWARWERCEREVLEQIERVADIDTPIVIEQPVAPTQSPVDSIPAEDRAAAYKLGLGENQPLPDYPESGRRPSWFREGFDPFGGR
jgi:hypothetical protein